MNLDRFAHAGRQTAALALLILALIPAIVLAWQMRHFEHLGYFHDDGMYWITGKSLAEGKGYRILSLPGAPYQTKYPPILPVLLSLVWKIFPDYPANMPWAMLSVAVMLPCFAWITVRLLKSWGCSNPAAMLVCAWMVINPYVVFLSVNLMPELLVSTLVGCSLLLLQKAARQDSATMALASGVLGGIACLTKTSASPLLAAGLLWFALRRQFRLAAWFAVPLGVLLVNWMGWSARHTTPSVDLTTIYYTSYLGDFLFDLHRWDWVKFLGKNIPDFLASTGNLLIPEMATFPLIGQNFSRLVGLFAMAGIVRRMRHDGVGPQHWFAGGFTLLLLVWQYPPNERLVSPILPLIAFGAQAELRHLVALIGTSWRSSKRDERVAGVVFAGLLVAVCVGACAIVFDWHSVQLPAVTSRRRAQSASNLRVYAWIKQNLAATEPILTNSDATVFLNTGHEAMRLTSSPKYYYRQDSEAVKRDFAGLPGLARSYGIRYLLLSQTDLDLDSFVNSIVDWKKLTSESPYRLLVRAPMTELYEIEGPKAR